MNSDIFDAAFFDFQMIVAKYLCDDTLDDDDIPRLAKEFSRVFEKYLTPANKLDKQKETQNEDFCDSRFVGV